MVSAPSGGPVVLAELFTAAAGRRTPWRWWMRSVLSCRMRSWMGHQPVGALAGRPGCAGDVVALAIPRSAGLVVAVWAVAKAGRGMCRSIRVSGGSRIAHIVTEQWTQFGLAVDGFAIAGPGCEWVRLGTHWMRKVVRCADRGQGELVRPSLMMAYVIYVRVDRLPKMIVIGAWQTMRWVSTSVWCGPGHVCWGTPRAEF